MVTKINQGPPNQVQIDSYLNLITRHPGYGYVVI